MLRRELRCDSGRARTVSGVSTMYSAVPSGNVLPPGVGNGQYGMILVAIGLTDTLVPSGKIPCRSFAFPSSTQLGNVGRNTGVGPGIANWDAALQKTVSVRENLKLQFRAETFNLLNRPNFGLPGGTVFGTNGQPLGTTGVINSTTVDSREFQFGLRLSFQFTGPVYLAKSTRKYTGTDVPPPEPGLTTVTE